jgi:beta-galactosidase
MQDVKYNYRPLKIEADEDGIIITNRNLFTDASDYACIITVEKNGTPEDRRVESFGVKPLSTKRFKWPFKLPEADKGEYVITLSFVLKMAESYADLGHEVAWGQYVYGKIGELKHTASKLKVVHGMNGIGVYGDCFSAMFSGLQGGLISYVYGGKELIEKMPKPNFWRPMTDNDMGSLQFARSAQWKTASEFTGTRYRDRNEVKFGIPVIKEHRSKVEVIFDYLLYTRPEKTVKVGYTVYADGWIDVEMTMPRSDDVGELPEFSMIFTLDADYDSISWYGNGPEETYADRECGKIGVYCGPVKNMFAPYLRPQESGAHTGVRTTMISDAHEHGLSFFGHDLMVSALPYKPSEIENADHSFDLPEVHYTYVRVGLGQMGVGGDDSWGARTLPQYMINNKKALKLKFSFRGV